MFMNASSRKIATIFNKKI